MGQRWRSRTWNPSRPKSCQTGNRSYFGDSSPWLDVPRFSWRASKGRPQMESLRKYSGAAKRDQCHRRVIGRCLWLCGPSPCSSPMNFGVWVQGTQRAGLAPFDTRNASNPFAGECRPRCPLLRDIRRKTKNQRKYEDWDSNPGPIG